MRLLERLSYLAILVGAAVMLYGLTGCAVEHAPVAPHVGLFVVNSDPGRTPSEPRAEHLDGANAWSPLGFEFAFEYGAYGRTECGRRWYTTDFDPECQITIGVVVTPFLVERRGTDALSNREERWLAVDSRLTGEALRIAIAHEVGHIVLDSPEHTASGIMSGQTSRMSDDDRDLACESIGICI